jgi:hypothetical protein
MVELATPAVQTVLAQSLVWLPRMPAGLQALQSREDHVPAGQLERLLSRSRFEPVNSAAKGGAFTVNMSML